MGARVGSLRGQAEEKAEAEEAEQKEEQAAEAAEAAAYEGGESHQVARAAGLAPKSEEEQAEEAQGEGESPLWEMREQMQEQEVPRLGKSPHGRACTRPAAPSGPGRSFRTRAPPEQQ